jgi:hypothetical protein
MSALMALQAIVSAITLALVLAACRLTIEIETLEDLLTSGSGDGDETDWLVAAPR